MKKLSILLLSLICVFGVSYAQNISVETTNGQVTTATVDGIPIDNDLLSKTLIDDRKALFDKEKRQKQITDLLSSNESLARTNEGVYLAPGLGLEAPGPQTDAQVRAELQTELNQLNNEIPQLKASVEKTVAAITQAKGNSAVALSSETTQAESDPESDRLNNLTPQQLNDEIAADIQRLGDMQANGASTADIIKLENEISRKNSVLAAKAAGGGTRSAGEQALIDQVNASANAPIGATGLNTAQYAAQYDGRPVFDGPGIRGGAREVASRLDTGVSREANLKILIIGWTNFLLGIAALMAVVALVWAGFLYITAFGDDSRMETAKKIVIWVIGGILLILGAYAIVNTVMQAVF